MPTPTKMTFILPFRSTDKALLLRMTNEVLETVDPELRSRVGGWLASVDGAVLVAEPPSAVLDLTVNPEHIEEIRETLTRWWDHFAAIHGVAESSTNAASTPRPWWKLW
ncbi:MAG: hypothetical protein U0166_00430 [Acidobacteriota bacterium]